MTETATDSPAEAAAEAAEASAEAAEAAAEAAEAEAETEEAEAGGDDDQGGDDTTVIVVESDGGDAEDAQDDATNLDHEQRITRLEERLTTVESTANEAAMRSEIAEMIAGHSHEDVVAEAAAVAEATAEAHDEAEETGEPATVRVDEPAGGGEGDIVTVTPDVPDAAEEGGRKHGAARSLFRW